GIDINSFSILIDGIDETRNAVVTSASMQYKPSLQDGKHILKLFINDTVGNSKTVTTSFELDTTPPEVKMNSPANNSFVRRTISVSGIATDMHLDMVSLEIDGIKVSSASTYTWDTTLVKDGTHEIKLNAVDTVKNLASTSINVTVDNTPPVIQLSPANGTEFYSDQNLTIDYNATDATSGVASSSVALDGTAVTKGDIIDLRNLSIGSHKIRV
ncbi:MAG: Ig-like domain-containing protein, partial [Candidatus Methanoperedens sp.]